MQNIQNVHVLRQLATEREGQLRRMATRVVGRDRLGSGLRRRLGEWLVRLGAWVVAEPSASRAAPLGAR